MFKLLTILFCFNVFAGVLAPVPNPSVTTGAMCTDMDANFDGYRYPDHVAHCRRSVSYALKQEIYEEYGISENCRNQYTIDHFIPLAIGGSNDRTNLWPEHKAVKHTRQSLEDNLYNALRRGEATQEKAVKMVIREKTTAPPVTVEECR